MASEPGDAAKMRHTARFGFRYQYLAGGVNTGKGWATWNENGSFATRYIQDSIARKMIPVFPYYMMLQSNPAGGDEKEVDLAHANSVAVMRAYYADLKLFFQKAHEATTKPVVLHVEPDFWGYAEQASKNDNAATVPAAVASTGLTELAGLPNTVAGFAQAVVVLRDKLAPNVILAYHMSGWGTLHDIVYEKPSNAVVRAYATRSAKFEQSLGAKFDISFEDFSDRDAGFYQVVQGNSNTWFKPADFRRHLLYAKTFVRLTQLRMVAWQIPYGNTIMRAESNTWNHYQDNRVQWLLGSSGRSHLRAYAKAGVVAFLFGRGADGPTCACDASGDGITNPAPINGNTQSSYSADDDGGYFRVRAKAYHKRGPLKIPG
ncbi:MAG TPA: hypothetical protein VII83_04995 [Gaiellaceae bacterium]